jgi:hypothetical protein
MPFNSAEFRQFCARWNISMVTSSPTYYRSHGLVERCVQIVKQMLRKSRELGEDSFLALLELRNTPLSGIGFSPAELSLSRRLCTMVPVMANTLVPWVVSNAREKLLQNQVHQKKDYDRGTRPLAPLEAGDTVRVRISSTWEPAQVTGKCDTPRSYDVITSGGQHLRRNRSQLLATKGPPPIVLQDVESNVPGEGPGQPSHSVPISSHELQPSNPTAEKSVVPSNDQPCTSHTSPSSTGTVRTRYGRTVKPPVRFGFS